MYFIKKTARLLGWMFLILMASVSIGIGGATPVPLLARKEDLYPEQKTERIDKKEDKEEDNKDKPLLIEDFTNNS